jgi:excisionase family DNA binding protein
MANRRSLLIEDAAVLLGVSRRTVYYRIRDGQLETVRTRGGSQRVLLSSIEQMLRVQRGLPREGLAPVADAGSGYPDGGDSEEGAVGARQAMEAKTGFSAPRDTP